MKPTQEKEKEKEKNEQPTQEKEKEKKNNEANPGKRKRKKKQRTTNPGKGKKKKKKKRTANPGKRKEEKKKKKRTANLGKRKKKVKSGQKLRLVLFAGPSCVFNYKNAIELWKQSYGNRVIVCQITFLLQVPLFLSYELWKLRIELQKLLIQTGSKVQRCSI